tara:strand:+ start:1054 stop:1479 length:426 start_codon:yes stop_codon:yes gene_type:complete
MIKYKLSCKNCLLSFDSWFSSSKEYEKLKKIKYISCHNCNSTRVNKSLMTPNLSNSKKGEEIKNHKKFNKVKNKIKQYQKFIKNNFEYVGDNFTYEARSIHYNKVKTKKGIYGNATLSDIEELKDEGIETETIPWIKENEN